MKKSLLPFIFLGICTNIYCQIQISQLSLFQQNAIKHSPDYFHMDDYFFIVGTININNTNIVIAYNMHYWGASTSRVTGRLLFFKEEGTFIGMYGIINIRPLKMMPNDKKIVFVDSYKYDYIVSVDFSSGIPKEIGVDGPHEYEEIIQLE
jgi:hypothetical protein